MKFSQNNEEIVIHNYFGNKKGTFLDIGAHDGKDLSNTWALSQSGWGGVCIEPSPEIFERLEINYQANKDVFCFMAAIGTSNEVVTFYNNPEYYSTTSIADRDKWLRAGQKFKEIDVQMLGFNSFLLNCPIQTFDFISLDAEGLDWEILQQMDLKALKCQLLCVEHNGIETQKYVAYANNFGLREIHRNNENIILGR